MTKYFFLTCLFLCITACKDGSSKNNSADEIPPSNGESSINTFVSSIEKAHQKESFLKEYAIQLELNIKFGGNERLKGTVTFSTDSSKGKLELTNGDTIIYIDDQVFHSSSMTNTQRIRFDAYTWCYFLLFPYKLSDDGTIWSSYPNSELGDLKYNAQKLSFKSDVGDAPDDWYVVYANPNSNLLEVAAYIVTSGKTIEEAEADPHAIKYEDFAAINNIPIARKWTFWEWESELGLTKQIGEATLKNIKFIEDQNLFEVPQGFLKN